MGEESRDAGVSATWILVRSSSFSGLRVCPGWLGASCDPEEAEGSSRGSVPRPHTVPAQFGPQDTLTMRRVRGPSKCLDFEPRFYQVLGAAELSAGVALPGAAWHPTS